MNCLLIYARVLLLKSDFKCQNSDFSQISFMSKIRLKSDQNGPNIQENQTLFKKKKENNAIKVRK